MSSCSRWRVELTPLAVAVSAVYRSPPCGLCHRFDLVYHTECLRLQIVNVLYSYTIVLHMHYVNDLKSRVKMANLIECNVILIGRANWIKVENSLIISVLSAILSNFLRGCIFQKICFAVRGHEMASSNVLNN